MRPTDKLCIIATALGLLALILLVKAANGLQACITGEAICQQTYDDDSGLAKADHQLVDDLTKKIFYARSDLDQDTNQLLSKLQEKQDYLNAIASRGGYADQNDEFLIHEDDLAVQTAAERLRDDLATVNPAIEQNEAIRFTNTVAAVQLEADAAKQQDIYEHLQRDATDLYHPMRTVGITSAIISGALFLLAWVLPKQHRPKNEDCL